MEVDHISFTLGPVVPQKYIHALDYLLIAYAFVAGAFGGAGGAAAELIKRRQAPSYPRLLGYLVVGAVGALASFAVSGVEIFLLVQEIEGSQANIVEVDLLKLIGHSVLTGAVFSTGLAGINLVTMGRLVTTEYRDDGEKEKS